MARQVDRLTSRQAQTATAPGKYADGRGLYLHVGPGGSKSWVLRYRLGTRRRDMGLGGYPLFGLADARARADTQRRLLADKIDPLAARQVVVARTIPTFGTVAEEYIARKAEGWRDVKEAGNWRAMLATYAATLMPLSVNEIDVAMVLRLVEPLWSGKPKLANKLRSRIAAVLSSATVRGYRQGDNPAAWRGHLQHSGLEAPERLAVVTARKALPHADVPALIAELQALDTIAAKATEFLVLTCSRAGEVVAGERNVGAMWAEIDLEACTWTIPAERMKSRREHRVPLSDRAVALLTALPRNGDKVFPASYWTVGRLLKSLRPGADAHGFRASFANWARDTGIDETLADQCLAHTIGSRTKQAYFRSDSLERRRQIMEAWARYCGGEGAGENVVVLRSA